jgi:hypothetical protein
MSNESLSEMNEKELQAWVESLSDTSIEDAVNSKVVVPKFLGAAFRDRYEFYLANQSAASITRQTQIKNQLLSATTTNNKGSDLRNLLSGLRRTFSPLPKGFMVGVAACVALVFGGSILLNSTQESDELKDEWIVLRGDEKPQVMELRSAEVTAKTEQIVALLQRSNAKYLLAKNAKGTQFQAKIEPTSQLARDLTALGVLVPEHGRLNLVLQIQEPNR